MFKKIGENDFYHVSQKFESNVWDLVKKNWFFPIDIGIALKNLKNVYLPKANFIIHWLIAQFVIKVMSMFLTFGKHLEWKVWKLLIICI